MSKGTKSVDAKEIACYFYKQVGRPIDDQIARHTISIKKALNTYTKEELMHAIKTKAKNPPLGGIYSFGFIMYNIMEVIGPFRREQAIEEARIAMTKVTDFGELPKASNTGSKLDKFGARKEVDWNA